MSVLSFFASRKVATFTGGLVAGLSLPLIVRSKTARRVTVSAVAKGLKLRDDAQAAYESIKEDAQDVYAEAKQRAADAKE